MSSDLWLTSGLALAAFLLVVLGVSLLRLRLLRTSPLPTTPDDPAPDTHALLPPAEITVRLMRRFQERNTDPAITAQLHDEHAFLICRPGVDPLIVPAAQVYQAYARYPDRLETVLDHTIEGLLQAFDSPDPLTLPFDELRWMIMPRLRRHRPEAPDDPTTTPFGHDLEISLVVESPHRVATLPPDMLERWSVTPAELRELALANLELRSASIPVLREWIEDGNPIYMFEARDGYDATRILLVELWRELARQAPGELYIAVPNRDFLIAFTDHNSEIFDRIQARILEDHQREQHPLTWKLFTVTPQGIEPHSPILH